MRPIVFLDTETTSLGPQREVWEVGMIKRTNEGQEEINFFLPVTESKADPMSLKIGGFYQRHPWYAGGVFDPERPQRYVSEGRVVEKWFAARGIQAWTADAFIVGAVPNFDTEVLERFLRKQGFLPRWHYHLRDIEAMAVGYLAGRGGVGHVDGDWKSDDLSAECGVKPPTEEERHTALGDARWAMRWYDAIMGGVS